MPADPDIRTLIHPHTGRVFEICPTKYGFSSDLTALVECEKGPFFVKAMRNRPGGRRDSITRERTISPFVRPVAPALRWHAQDEGWIVLGFEVVEGWPSDFKPGSPDLPAVVELLNRIGILDLPAVARDWPETRWDRFTIDSAQTRLFRGDALLHTDINPDNLLVAQRGGWVVDWSWPTRGAAFIDPACLVVQLVAAGHSAETAENWADNCTAWREANPRALDAFASATVRMYRRFAERRPDEAWRGAMVQAAEKWSAHRGLSLA